MHEYDIAFKLTLQQVDVALRELIGTTIARGLNVELPEVRNTRVDCSARPQPASWCTSNCSHPITG
jgi:hypothetical protein